MPKAKVNGVEVEFEPGMTVLQVAELAGEEIPRFCYHERLSIAGNCRMCLVEVKPGPPKPQASCALPAAENQEIFTNTPMVKKAREGVMEFLLINHPLDCPICDQGGECDLQDQAMGYGRDDSRFALNKRAVEEKAMGPLINTVMTRCIQCTRCVRFISEVAGVPEIGLISRGEDVEITTYLGSAVTSELSGNVIDLCPVGALTSKPYAFNARPWELKKTETVDVMDAMGAAIRVDSRGPAVLRVLPRINEDVNEEWISDKTRFAVDGLARQRLDSPYIRDNGRLRPATWAEALSLAADRLSKAKPERIGAIAGDLQDAESLKATLDLFRALGSANTDCRQDGMALGAGPRESWLFNATIAGLDEIDAVLLVGTNPRFEAPVLNARLRRRWLAGDLAVSLAGEAADLTYDYEHLGDTAAALTALAKARSGFAKVLKGAKSPALIIGAGALSGPNGAAVAHAAAQVAKAFGLSWNVLHTAASRVGGLDMGFVPGEGGLDARAMTAKGALDVLFLLGADEIDLSASDAFRIYLGSHGDAGAHAADLILPGAAYTEKDGLYVNLEGRVQMGQRAVFPKGEAREDWTILRALSERLGKTLPYDSLDQLRARLFADHPTFGQIDWAPRGQADLSAIGAAGDLGDTPLSSAVKAFHLTNPVARASVTMAECAALAAGPAKLAAE
ncbi:NADH-quinone oxidoreductase subunit NuoG [Phenylobacterium sp.]|uniref:NADH-quinone oxidoreductase subunit NuoG n=1 Tax=Phenylobacterium sp. TaxID=1871053 RepID=UPI0025EBC909|nr:NADH-quinone oxidoreductase subunit NuoG [Phenylobacterium sp.]MCA6285663.1 NADH-quinone oxidoreductase subunit G [Phenylobacterium sp.]MCA6309988.1 NADH-quinone oxidoreductase subunit G [Phenylobacterium sp.]MCA6322530.1 NADH-quinone oxidoreductase subunit G [Phenylobacterium sp.]MCA6335902.1 NADH-quinone oxidoreductase subunit G [Phenylobacterium sp.]MCA6338646.1 NADH-quinone oxidoreductase subunit G [Phenylobacterium sp.]